ncbi:uncharacterized protein [Ptychodera flava]|uniref:uncharacterized protein n=1 Tax=Ptychodera flava TaxID=63121 RepID=UPI00396A0B6F
MYTMKKKEAVSITLPYALLVVVHCQVASSSEWNNTCHPTCVTCYGQSPLQCSQCLSLRAGNECVQECPNGTVAMETHRTNFSQGALDDNGDAASGLGLHNILPESPAACCHPQCLGGCSGITAADCRRCKEAVFQGRCVEKCPEEISFADPDYPYICRRCHEQCQGGCTGETSRDCQRCKYFRILDGECVTSCPPGSFANRDKCAPCHDACLECRGGSDTHCIRCKHVMFGYQCLKTCPEHTRRNDRDECVEDDDEDDEESRKIVSLATALVLLLFGILFAVVFTLAIVFRKKVRKKLQGFYDWFWNRRETRGAYAIDANRDVEVTNTYRNSAYEADFQTACTPTYLRSQENEVETQEHTEQGKSWVSQGEKSGTGSMTTPSDGSVTHSIEVTVGDQGRGDQTSETATSTVKLRRGTTERGDKCRSISDVLEKGYESLDTGSISGFGLDGDTYSYTEDYYNGQKTVSNVSSHGSASQSSDVRRAFPSEGDEKVVFRYSRDSPSTNHSLDIRGIYKAQAGRASRNLDSGYYTDPDSLSRKRPVSQLSEADQHFTSPENSLQKLETLKRSKGSESTGSIEGGTGDPEGYVVFHNPETLNKEGVCGSDSRRSIKAKPDKRETCPHSPFEKFCPLKWNILKQWHNFKSQNEEVALCLNQYYYKTQDFIVGRFDKQGGHLLFDEHGVNLYIPHSAIPDDERWEIYMHVTLDNNDGSLSPTIECGPSKHFQRHVILSFPHCAENVKNWNLDVEYSQTSFGDAPAWKSLPDGQDSKMVVLENVCYMYIDHFTRFRLVERARGPRNDGSRQSRLSRVLARSARSEGSATAEQMQGSSKSDGQVCKYCSSPLKTKSKLVMVFRSVDEQSRDVTFRVYILDNTPSVKQNIESDEVHKWNGRRVHKWNGRPLQEPPHTFTMPLNNDTELEMKMTSTTQAARINPRKHVFPIQHVWSTPSVYRSFKVNVDQSFGKSLDLIIEVTLDGRTLCIPISENSVSCEMNRANVSQIAKTNMEHIVQDEKLLTSAQNKELFLSLQPEFKRHLRDRFILPHQLFRNLCFELDIEKPDTPSPNWRHLAERLELPTDCIQWIESQKDGGRTRRVLDFWEAVTSQKQRPLNKTKAISELADMLKDIGHDKARNLLQRRSSDSGVSGVTDLAIAVGFAEDL